MPLSDEVRNLLLKYIAGETSREEAEKVERWLSEDPSVFMEFEQLWDLWYAVGTATNVFRFNVDKGWQSLVAKRFDSDGKRPRKTRVRRMLLWSGAAAAVLLAAVLLLWRDGRLEVNSSTAPSLVIVKNESITRGTSAEATDSVIRVATSGRERKLVKLPGGSKVWLNGNSELHFTYGRDARILRLKGEGFFDVTHDVKRPFIVKTTHASIQALGTRFDVVAYPKDTVTDAILTSGSILFTTEIRNHSVIKQLVPGDKLSMNYLSNSLKISQVDTAFYVSWKEGRLMFQGQKFQDIAKAMGRKYNVNFRFEDQGLADKRLNGYLDKESLAEALQALKLTLQFRYRIVDSMVVIYH